MIVGQNVPVVKAIVLLDNIGSVVTVLTVLLDTCK